MTWRIIGNQRERGLNWAIPRLGYDTGLWNDASCLILEKDNDIAACVVYNFWYPEASVELSVASAGKNWLTRPFLTEVFRVPFIQWRMRRVGSSIAADNLASIRFCTHCGFQQEGRIREGYGAGIDLLKFGMLKNECRWIGPENEQRLTASRARPRADRQCADAIQYRDGNQ